MRSTSVCVWAQPCCTTRRIVPTIEMPSARSISGEAMAKAIWNSQAWGMPMKARPEGRCAPPRRDASTGIATCRTPSGSAACPARAGFRALRSRPRRLRHRPLPALALDRDGQVLILGQGVFGIAAHVVERLATPCAHRAGHDHDRVEPGQRAAFDVLRGDIFHRLPAGDEVDPVADFGIARHRADFGLLEPAHELADGLRLELGIGVERDDDLAVGSGEGAVERAGLAAVGQGHQPHARLVPKACATMALVGPSSHRRPRSRRVRDSAGQDAVDRSLDHALSL
jgi:hypothetical protein